MWFTDAAATVGGRSVRGPVESQQSGGEGGGSGAWRDIYNMHDSRERVDTGVHFIKFEVASGSPYFYNSGSPY